MNTPKFSISIVTAAMILFMVLCNSRIDVSSELLFALLMVLHVGLVWMVFTILKKQKPVHHVPEDSVYDKVGINKNSDPDLTVV